MPSREVYVNELGYHMGMRFDHDNTDNMLLQPRLISVLERLIVARQDILMGMPCCMQGRSAALDVPMYLTAG